MKNSKIAVVILLVTSMMFSLFTGCGNNSGSSSNSDGSQQGEINMGPETGEISFYVAGGPTELALWDSLIQEFEAQNEGIKVKTVLFSSYDTVYSALPACNALYTVS